MGCRSGVWTLLVGAILLTCGGFGGVVWAAEGSTAASSASGGASAPGPVIDGKAALLQPLTVVVDTLEAMDQSKAMVAIREQYGKYENQFRAQVQSDEAGLNQTAQDLEKQRATLAPGVFAEKEKAFEQKVGTYQRKSQTLRNALEKSNRTAVSEVQSKLIEVIGETAQALGANLVLSKTQIILYDPRMDITKLVVEKLNAKLPVVAFPVPNPDADGAAAQAPNSSEASKTNKK